LNKIILKYCFSLFCISTLILISCQDESAVVSSTDFNAKDFIPEEVDFNFHVKPILSDRCFKCHGPDEKTRQGGLAFHEEALAFAALGDEQDHFAIVRKAPEKSEMIQRINSDDPDYQMPPPESNLKLSANEKEIIKRWIEQGATWKKHWAFIPPKETEIPEVTNQSWPKNEIDFFVLKKIEDQGLTISEKAAKEKLIRRIAFDLTGLAPTKKEIERFLQDSSTTAVQNVIKQYLATDAYAERMATEWLDLSRYADTNGYQDDFERFNWPWRDWVIHAFKNNMPYDEFVTWQLAGDLLPNSSLEQKLATGFNRNHKITNEGGVIEEEYRVEYVSDRTNTFATAFLGLTFECAKCHDHKYDPISQKNYYQLFSFFNNVPEKGFYGGGEIQEPTIKLTDEQVATTLSFINHQDSIGTINYMVMEEMPEPRQAYILNRGAYDQQTEPVDPSTPESVLAFSKTFEQNRLGLANWLFDEENPLTARVVVNRLWQQVFGQGIVASSFDFGNQGSLPTHPELLDYLALKFISYDWDVKKMLAYIMQSATYQQSTKMSKKMLELDPENLLLARAPRTRLPAEMIRDHALAISDLLVKKVGGPSVKPYQPEGLWEETTGGGGGSTSKYVPDEDDGQYRRSLYTFWKRTVPPPNMMTFDASSRDICSVKREQTSTPLQALVLMNDPQIIEASKMLAYRSIENITEENSERLAYMFQLATSRIPSSDELSQMENFFNEEKDRFENNPEDAKALLAIGKMMDSEEDEVPTIAAYTSVANMIINLDETITRG